MSACLDWGKVAREADRFLSEDSAERMRALRHVEECPSCRRAALRFDPTLAVTHLAPAEVESSDVEAVKRQVEAMRRVRAMEIGRRGSGLAHAAAVILLLGVGFMFAGPVRDPNAPATLPQITANGPGSFFDAGNRRSTASLAVVESISPSSARIYHLDQQDFPVVMIVDESIDL